MLVVDATVALAASARVGGFGELPDELFAPPLMWSEATSALHELVWRREVAAEDAAQTFRGLFQAPIKRREPPRLRMTAWQIADELGLAKTYDAEYLALGRQVAAWCGSDRSGGRSQ